MFLGLLAVAARAEGPRFWDDFEAPDFSTWTSVDLRAGATAERLPMAARWGTGGLRVVDDDVSAGPGDMTALYWAFDAGVKDLAFRFWANLTVTADAGEALVGQLYEQNRSTACAFVVRSPGSVLVAWDSAGTFRVSPAVPLPGGWHRYECRVFGLGADAGRLEAWLDETLVASANDVDWTAVAPDFIAVGQPYSSDRRFTGMADFDHVSLDEKPTPVRVKLVVPGAGGPCRPAQLLALGAAGEPVSSRRALRVDLAVDGGLAFADDACLVPTTTVEFPPSATTARFTLLPTRPQVDLVLSGEDLLTSSVQLEVSVTPPDAGRPEDARDGGAVTAPPAPGRQLVVGCGCSEVQLPLVLSLLGSPLMLRRRRAPARG